MTLALVPLLHGIGLPQNRYIDGLWASGITVALMVYLVMPRYTKLLRHWLFN
jgi:antibiotic biosynthesis monooxygenase (ABM) superfamily enzyme